MLLAHAASAETCTQDCTSISLTAGNVGNGCFDLAGTSSGNTCSIPTGLDVPYGLTINIGSGVTVNVGSSDQVYGISIEVDCGGAINNAGTLTASGVGSEPIGIYNNGGTINNAGTMSGTASGTGAIGVQTGGGCSNGITNIPAGPFNNAGTLTATATGSESYGLFNSGNLNDYCGVTPSYNSEFPGPAPTTYSCYTVTFDQSGIPTSGVTWGVTTSWGPFPAVDNTGTGASIPVEATGALTYSYDTPVGSADYNYNCNSGCSGTPTISGAANYAASYLAVAKATSTTTVSCSPSSVGTGSPTTCTATVSGSSPTGTVSFTSSSGTGTFSPSNGQCGLSSGSCSVTYSDNIAGSSTIAASYGGDSNNAPSSNTFSQAVTINPSPTFSISPNSVGPYLGTSISLTGFSFAPSNYFACLSTSSATTSSCATTPIGGYVVNSGGAYYGSITVPSATAPGSYYVIVYTGTTVYVSASFTIASLPASTFSISPTSVGPNLGATITATATNFVPGLYDACLSTTSPTVSCVTTPVGGLQISAGTGFTGSYSSSITVPASQAPGSYFVVVYTAGSTTAYTSASFTINPPLDTTFSVSPTSVGPYVGTTIALTGASFAAGNYVACLSTTYPSVSCVTTPTGGLVVGSGGPYSESVVVPSTTASSSYYVDVYLATSTTAYVSASFVVTSPPAPTFSLSSSSVGPYLGATITLTGTNFVPGNYVACLSNSIASTSGCVTTQTGGYIITASSSYTGAYTESLTVPPSTASGNYYVIVFVSGASTPYLSAGFAIAAPPPPTLSLSSSSVGPYLGTTISLTGANFAPGNYEACLSDSLVSTSGCVTTPTGGYIITASSSYTGAYSQIVVVPPTTASGNYYVIAYVEGFSSPYISEAFTITTPPSVSFSVSPTSVGPYLGTTITLTGTNFAPGNYEACLSNSVVSTSGCVTSPGGGFIITASSTYTGAYSESVVVPPTTLPSNYYVMVYVEGFSSPYISAPFPITSPPSPTLSLSSSSIGPYLGTTVSLTGTSFVPGNYEACLSDSLVSTSGCVTTPTGGLIITAGSSYTGAYSEGVVVPPSTLSGSYFMIVFIAGESAPYISAPFTITQPPHATLSLSSSSVGPYLGTTITLTGANFAPGNYVACLSNSVVSTSGCVTAPTGGYIITASSSYTGAYSESVVVPPQTLAGNYYVIVYVYGDSAPYISAPFTINQPGRVTFSISPGSVAPGTGTTITLTGANFAPGNYQACLSDTYVSTSGCVTAPTGGYIITASSSYTGAYSASVVVPSTTPSGNDYVIVFTGITVETSAAFTVNSPAYVISDETSCLNLPASAEATETSINTCSVAGTLTIYSGDSLTVDSPWTLQIVGTLDNSGTLTLNTDGGLQNIGAISNTGLINNVGTPNGRIDNDGGAITNDGTIYNGAGPDTITNTGTIYNYGLLNNDGLLTNNVLDSSIGTITNEVGGTINNDYSNPAASPPLIQNSGGAVLDNLGTINNYDDNNFPAANVEILDNSPSTITNSGSINNYDGIMINSGGELSNSGTVTDYCGVVTGTVVGNPVVLVCSYSVTFGQTGIPPGVTWGVTANSVDYTGTGPSITVAGLTGTQTYSYDSPVTGSDAAYGCAQGCSGSVSGVGTISASFAVIKSNPTISTSLSLPTIEVGQSVTDSATLAGEYEGAGGSVSYEFFPGPTCSGSGTLVGAALPVNGGLVPSSAPQPFLASGSYGFEAVYSGDANNNGATSGCEPLTVSQASSSVSTKVFDATVNLPWAGSEVAGASAYDTSGVTGVATVAPIGSVTYTFYDDDACSTAASSQTVVVFGGSAPASSPTGALGGGSYSYSASYSGDSNYLGSSSPCESFNVQKAAPTVSTTVEDASTNTPWTNKEVTGASFYDTAVVTGIFGFNPTGSVTYAFFVNDPFCSTTPVSTDAVTLSGGVVPSSSTQGPLGAGPAYNYQATYSGDSNYQSAVGPCEDAQVNQAIVTLSTSVSPSTTVPLGTTVYDTVTATGVSGFPPAGQVSLLLFPSNSCGGGLPIDSQSGLSLGTPSTGETLGAGQYSYQLTGYFGDPNYAFNKVDLCEPFTVSQGTAVITTTVSPSTSVTAGTSVSDTAFATGVAGFAPTNTVTISMYSGNSCGGAALNSQANVFLGKPSTAVSSLGAGSYSYQAVYAGDPNYVSGTTGPCEAFTVTPAPTSASVQCSPATTAVDEPVTCSATVEDIATGTPITPTGEFVFTSDLVGFPPNPCDLNPVANSPAEASCSIQYAQPLGHEGTAHITGSYSGNQNLLGSSSTFALTVTKASSSVAVSCSPSNVVLGSSTICTASVTGVAPTGSVILSSSSSTGTFNPPNGQCNLAAGVCSVSYSDVTTGAITITAAYAGDSNNLASSGTTSLTESYKSCAQVTGNGGQNLKGADLEYCNFGGYNLSGDNLMGANMQYANLQGANLKGANLMSASLTGANGVNADLAGANLMGDSLSKGNFAGADFQGANMKSDDLSYGNFVGADFQGVNLMGANMSYGDFDGANFTGANTNGVVTTGATFVGAVNPP